MQRLFVFLGCLLWASVGSAAKNPVITIATSEGDIKAVLYADKAPKSVENFLDYVTSGFYEGTIFHRVIPGFMIQGGGFKADLGRKPTKAPVKNEATNNLSNERGTLAMARTGVVDSATSQFFINVNDNRQLDHRSPDPGGYGYAVFGKVLSGMKIVDKIVNVPRCPGAATCSRPLPPGMRDVPAEAVVIKSIKVKNGKDKK